MDRDAIAKLAKLSRLELTPAEADHAVVQIGRLLDHFAMLATVDTEGVEPSPYPRPIALATRQDLPTEPLPVDAVLGNAPARRAGQFLVPKVIDA